MDEVIRNDIEVRREARQAWREWWPRNGFGALAPEGTRWFYAKEIAFTLVLVPTYFCFLAAAKCIAQGLICVSLVVNRYIKWRSDRQLLGEIAYASVHQRLQQDKNRKKGKKKEESTSESASPGDRTPRAQDESLLFTLLPVEVRRRILIYVFGNKTLHMDLRLRRSIHPSLGKHSDAWTKQYWAEAKVDWEHAGIVKVQARQKRSETKLMWRWFSCVCHRFPAFGPDRLPYGRRCNQVRTVWREPEGDTCLKGGGCCIDWPSNEGCFIGIMGWLLLCRQAYIEGVEILYRFNTISISSNILIRGFQDILAPQIVASLVSLELVWNMDQVPMAEAFTGLTQLRSKKQHKKQQQEIAPSQPVFPDLKHLRICSSISQQSRSVVYTLPDSEEGQELRKELMEQTLPAVDELLERIAPPKADVTFSCRNFSWFTNIREALNELQGTNVTGYRESELGGRKIWRKTPPKTSGAVEGVDNADEGKDQMVEEGRAPSSSRREGFWIHVSKAAVSR